eukprot:5886406-Amphidinium_carterae.1
MGLCSAPPRLDVLDCRSSKALELSAPGTASRLWVRGRGSCCGYATAFTGGTQMWNPTLPLNCSACVPRRHPYRQRIHKGHTCCTSATSCHSIVLDFT